MKAAEFKTGLKKVSSQLKGLTISFITPFGVTPFKSLNAFGNAILEEEAKGNILGVAQVWTSNGIVQVSSFDQLSNLLQTSNVKAVQFQAIAIQDWN